MSFDILGILTGISPWWWVAAGLAFGALELLTFTYILVWPAIAAITVAVALFISPDLAGALQMTIFAVSSIGYGGVGWLVMGRLRDRPTDSPGLNRRADALTGRSAVVRVAFSAGIGAVEVDGVQWRGRLRDAAARPPEPGETLEIVAVDGATLILAQQSGT